MSVKKPNNDIVENFKEALEITGGLRESAYQQIAPVIETVRTLPDILKQLDERGIDSKDVDRVLNIAATLGRDADTFKNEMSTIDAKFLPIQSRVITKPKHAVKDYTRLLTLSTQYHDVGSRFMDNTDRVLSDYTDLCEDLLGLETTAPELPTEDLNNE